MVKLLMIRRIILLSNLKSFVLKFKALIRKLKKEIYNDYLVPLGPSMRSVLLEGLRINFPIFRNWIIYKKKLKKNSFKLFSALGINKT